MNCISVIIPTYQREKEVQLAMDSVKNQGYSIEFIIKSEKGNVASLINQAVCESHHDYILIMDDDATIEDYFINEAIKTFDLDPQIAIVFGYVSDRDFVKTYNLKNPDIIQYTGSFYGCAFIVKKEAWIEVNGFNEKYNAYYTEPDIAARLIKKGWKIIYNPKCRATHDPTILKSSTRQIFLMIKNHYFFIWEHLPFSIALFQSVKWFGWSIVKGIHHPASVINAYVDILREFPNILEKREPIKDILVTSPWKVLFRN